jgi:UDP-N-acetylmuramate dehydrogenase
MQMQKNVSLCDKNWFRTGGVARFYAEPTNRNEVVSAALFAKEQAAEIFILGEGANILISDEGFNGLVIAPKNKQIIVDIMNETLTVGAGLSMPELIESALDVGLLGLEEFSGIPGTVGGSVFINIHYFEFLLSQFLIAATVIHTQTGEIKEVDNAWFNFGYNQSTLQIEPWLLFDATFQLKLGSDLEVAYARGRSHEISRHRSRRYPNERTCGSFFRNFLAAELPFEIEGKKVPFVAYYLDKVGVKGTLRQGNAVVSHLHANMLVTLPGATTADVIALARTMQEKVKEQFGIVPQVECQLIGFKEYPLYL